MTDDAAEQTAPSGFLRSRVVQLHPTLRCNLRCAHCYSSSEPRAATELPAGLLLERLAALRDEGYDVVSFSGGEPLLYRPLPQVARAAKELGYRVNLITNGLLLSVERVAALREVVSLVGVSLDGPAALHDQLRGAGSHARTVARLKLLRDAGIRFGVAHCVTAGSLAHLPDLVDFCLTQGARLLQLHPLTLAGRAAEECTQQALTHADLSRLYLMAKLLEVHAAPALQIQLDLAAVEHVLAGRYDYGVLRDTTRAERLADLVNPLVMDEKGALWPLAYGMANSQRVAEGTGEHWRRDIERYRAAGGRPLRLLLESALEALCAGPDAFVDWYGLLVQRSRHPVGTTGARLAVLQQNAHDGS